MAVFVIAEIGVNHDGSVDRAKHLIRAASHAGADAVKFQMFNSRELWGDDRITHLELSEENLSYLYKYSVSIGIEFMCTPFSVEAVKFLEPLVKRIKIASGCIGRLELLAAVRATGLPVILSTGMSNLTDIAEALAHLGNNVTLLHCTSAYPCYHSDVNLRAMDTMRETFRLPVGYSDHTIGSLVSLVAAARGATVIEKHITLDCNGTGPDHKSSAEPRVFKQMVRAIRSLDKVLGGKEKRPHKCERELRRAWREHPSPDRAP